jgi:hypothetical protein
VPSSSDLPAIKQALRDAGDIDYGEAASRAQKRRVTENFAVLRRLALSVLKRHPAKLSIACKRIVAAAGPQLLEAIRHPSGNSEQL